MHCVKRVHIRSYSCPHFSRISRNWTEYEEIRIISPYSVPMRENVGKMGTRITPNTDSFYAVVRMRKIKQGPLNTICYIQTMRCVGLQVMSTISFGETKKRLSFYWLHTICNSWLLHRKNTNWFVKNAETIKKLDKAMIA